MKTKKFRRHATFHLSTSAELARQAKSLDKLIKSKRAFRAEFGPMITVEGLKGFGRAAFSKKKVLESRQRKKERQSLELERREQAMNHWKNRPRTGPAMLAVFDKLLDGTPVAPKPHYLLLRDQARVKRKAVEMNDEPSQKNDEPSQNRNK
jgi:hypothetical protein